MTEGSNRLPVLAAEINESHRLSLKHATKAIEHAMRCGEMLTEAKAKVAHGQWLPGLRENVEFSDRSAQAYMRGWRRYRQNPQRVADLSFREALDQTTTPRRESVVSFDAKARQLLALHRSVRDTLPADPADWTIQDAQIAAGHLHETDEMFHRFGLCESGCPICEAEKGGRDYWAERIGASWARALERQREAAETLGAIRKAFHDQGDGDDEFVEAIRQNVPAVSSFAEQVPALLDDGHDAEAWMDAVLADLKAKAGGGDG